MGGSVGREADTEPQNQDSNISLILCRSLHHTWLLTRLASLPSLEIESQSKRRHLPQSKGSEKTHILGGGRVVATPGETGTLVAIGSGSLYRERVGRVFSLPGLDTVIVSQTHLTGRDGSLMGRQ